MPSTCAILVRRNAYLAGVTDTAVATAFIEDTVARNWRCTLVSRRALRTIAQRKFFGQTETSLLPTASASGQTVFVLDLSISNIAALPLAYQHTAVFSVRGGAGIRDVGTRVARTTASTAAGFARTAAAGRTAAGTDSVGGGARISDVRAAGVARTTTSSAAAGIAGAGASTLVTAAILLRAWASLGAASQEQPHQ